MELATEKSNTYESYMNKQNKKFVRFNGIVNVILIPDGKSLNIERSDSEYRVTIPTLKMHCALVFHY